MLTLTLEEPGEEEGEALIGETERTGVGGDDVVKVKLLLAALHPAEFMAKAWTV